MGAFSLIVVINLLNRLNENMATNSSGLDGFNCSVCSEVFNDPRPLPCGHLFCGPPKSCLTKLCDDSGNITCAECNTEHKIEIDNIAPLYRLRDALEAYAANETAQKVEEQQTKNEQFRFPPCEQHLKQNCELWCLDCNFAVCN